MVITTTDTIEGFIIKEYLGLIAISKDPRGFFSGINIDKITEKLQNEAKEKYDADAVIGIRFFKYDGTAENNIVAYGTAVKLERSDR